MMVFEVMMEPVQVRGLVQVRVQVQEPVQVLVQAAWGD